MVICQVNNCIYGGTQEEINSIEPLFQSTFKVGELKRGSFTVYGSKIVQGENGAIVVTQNKKMEQLTGIDIEDAQGKDGNLPATSAKTRNFMGFIGYMLFMALVSHPIMAYYSSDQASKSHKLRKHHLKTVNAHVRYLKAMAPQLLYRLGSEVSECVFEVYTDASLSAKGETASRAGWVILKRHGASVHPIAWNSRKLKRIATSSSAAETLAAASALDTALYIMELLKELGITSTVSLTTDSRSFFSLATTTKEPQENPPKLT